MPALAFVIGLLLLAFLVGRALARLDRRRMGPPRKPDPAVVEYLRGRAHEAHRRARLEGMR